LRRQQRVIDVEDAALAQAGFFNQAVKRFVEQVVESDANITFVGMDEDKEHMLHQLRFTVQVKDRVHLAGLLRNVRRVAGVNRILRERS